MAMKAQRNTYRSPRSKKKGHKVLRRVLLMIVARQSDPIIFLV